MLPSRRAKPPSPDVGELDERIRQVEERLVAREQALGRRAGVLGQRLRLALQPKWLAVPLLGGAAALVAVGWWAARHTGRAAWGQPAPGGPPPGPVPPAAHPWWEHVISIGWPLLPRVWREQTGPAVAVALGLGLAHRRRQSQAPREGAGVDPAG